MTKVLHLTEQDEKLIKTALNSYREILGKDRKVERVINLLNDPAYNILSLDRETLYEQLGEEVEISDEQLEELAFRVQNDIVQVGDLEKLVKNEFKELISGNS